MNTIVGVIVLGVILLPYFLVYNNLINGGRFEDLTGEIKELEERLKDLQEEIQSLKQLKSDM